MNNQIRQRPTNRVYGHSVSQNRGSGGYDCKMTITRTTNSNTERNECTHHRVIPHDHISTSTYKGAKGLKKQRGVTSLVCIHSAGGTPQTCANTLSIPLFTQIPMKCTSSVEWTSFCTLTTPTIPVTSGKVAKLESSSCQRAQLCTACILREQHSHTPLVSKTRDLLRGPVTA